MNRYEYLRRIKNDFRFIFLLHLMTFDYKILSVFVFLFFFFNYKTVTQFLRFFLFYISPVSPVFAHLTDFIFYV